MSKSTRTTNTRKPRAWQGGLRRHHIAAATLAMLGAGSHAAPVTWVGGDDGFWDVTGNWDAGQPGATADVQLLAFNTTLRSSSYGVRSLAGTGRLTLSGGSLSFTEASTLGSLLLSGGSLGGSGTLVVSGASEWQRGVLSGAGAATFSGGLAITGTDVHDIVGKRLVLAGISTWTNANAGSVGQIRTGNGAVIDNSGSFLDQTSASTTINNAYGGGATFINNGTYTKTGTGTTTAQIAFNNTGTINGTGLLVLSAGGTHTGNFAMDAGGTVQLNGGTHTFGGTNTTGGAGRLLLSNGATATAAGGSMSTNARWDLEGGTVSGAGSLALNGTANWTGTFFSGGSNTSFGGALAISGSGVHDVLGAALTFAGTTTWTNANAGNVGQIRGGNGTTLTNTGTFVDATVANTSINVAYNGGATFANSGTYQKTGGSTVNVSMAFNNLAGGTLQVDSGTLQLGGGGSGGGKIDVADAATLEYSGGTHTISGWTGGTGTGRVLVSAGAVNASGSNTLTGRVALSGGALNASGTLNTGGFDMSGGTLGGSGALDVNLAANSTGAWTNGLIARSGTTTFAGPLAIAGTGDHDVVGGRLVLGGTSTWTNANAGNLGNIRTGNGAVIDNSGSFLDQTSASTTINNAYNGGATFINSGTYTKTGTGTTTVQIAFNNTGTVNGTGLLVLSAGGTHTGNFAMGTGGTVQLNGGTHTFGGVNTTGGAGRLLLSNGATATAAGGSMSTQARWDLEGGTVSGAGSLALNGTANWTGTVFSGGSNTSFGGALAISGTGVHDVNGAAVTFAGTTTWTNANAGNLGQIRSGNGATLTNTGSFVDATVADTGINVAYNGGATFANSGTYQKTGGSTVNISTAFNNTASGTLQVDAGRLQLSGGGSGGGKIDVADAATLEYSGGTHTISGWTGGAGAGRVLVSGGVVNTSGSNALTGRVALSGGALNASGTFSAGGFEMSGGTLGGSGALDVNLAANSTGAWTNGLIARSGTTTFTGPLAIAGTGNHDVVGGRLVLGGTSTWTNANAGNLGNIRTGNGAVIDNSGSFLDKVTADTNINNVYGGGATFINSGTYSKTGSGTTTVQIAFNNTGTVNGTGLLVLSAGGTHTGNFAMDAGGTVQLNGGTHTFGGANTTGGAGRLLLSSGTATAGGGGMSTQARWDLEGGTVSGAGSLALNGIANWTGTVFNGGSNTRFGGALAISGSGVHDVNGAAVTFAGTTTWTNANAGNLGQIRSGNGASFTNTGSFVDATVADTGINAIYGGSATFANSGTYTKTGGSSVNVSIAASNAGTLTVKGGVLSLTGGLSNFAGSTLTGGTYEVFGPGILQFTGANVVTNAATLLLDGASSQLRNASNGANALANFATNSAAGRFTIQNGRNFTTLGAFNNEGWVQVGNASTFTSTGTFSNAVGATLQMAGGSFAGPTVPNAGWVSGFGSVAPAVANTGTVRASGGTLTLAGGVQGATGGVFVDTGATLVLGAPGSAATLGHHGSLLALGTNDITVHQDYDNASFGVGNSFDRRAAVSGSGLILAAGATQQTLSGALLQGGSTGSATIVLPNIRVGMGGITTEFSIHNVGSGGPSLRGALQNTGISNAGLSGSGVTAQNWGAIAQGDASAPFSITFDPTFGQALSGQTLQVVNNFDNVAGQTLTITGSAYNLANASPAAPNPVVFAHQREGGSLSQALSISNLAPANGFSESLNASISGAGPVLASGSFSLLAAGASNHTALVVSLDTSSAGAKAGTATIALASDGTGTSGFGALNIGTQTVNVSGNVYRLASASAATPNPVTLAHQRVGGTLTQSLSLTNTAAADGYSEGLNASIAASGAATAGGSFSVLAAGQSSNALFVGVDTSSAGAKTGTATLTLASDGTGTSGFSALDIGTQTVNVSGNVYRLASASAATPNPVTLAHQRVGGTLTQSLSLTNTAAADGYSEGLNASIAASGAATAGGSFSVLAAGQSSNALFVGVDTSSAGAKTGTATLTLASDGTGTSGFSALDIGTQTVNVSGNVYRLASASAATPNPVLLVNQRLGGSGVQTLTISNTALADGFSEGLNASIVGSGDITASGSFALLAAGATDSTSLRVGVDTSKAGSFSGMATITLASDGTGTSGFGALGIGTQTIQVVGNTYRLASASAATPNPVLFANQRVGGTATQALLISNTAAPDGFSESLNVSIGSVGPVNAGGSVNLLAAGASSNALFVGLDTSTAGAKAGTATLTLASDGAGTSGLGALGIGTQNVNVSGKVYRLATASAASPSPVVLANQRVGGTLSQALSLSNTAAADGFSEGLNASIAATGDATASGSFSVLAAGAASNALWVGIDTSSAGAKAGTATLTLASDGNGTSGFAALGIGTQTVNVSGNVYRLAQPVVDTSPIVLVARVGDAPQQRSVAVSNSGPDLFTERLNAGWAAAPAGWVAAGAVNGLAQGGSSPAMTLALATGSAGSFAGTAQVALVSSGAGTTEAADADLGQATVSVTGRVYAPAVAQLPAPVLSFGIVRVGDVVAPRNVALGNAASGALADTLHATLSGGAAPFAASGSASVAPGALDETSLSVQLDTAQAGVFNTTATLALSSRNGELADLALGDAPVLLQAQVNALASAGLALGDGAALLGGGAAAYTLDFGTLAAGGSALGATLSLGNLTLGTADALGGTWDLTGVGAGSSFTLSGFGSFAGLAAGSSLGGLSVSFGSGNVGHFEQVIVLRSLSTNGSGPDLVLGDVSLTLQGTVVAVPEPGTWVLMVGGLLLLARRARAAQRQAAVQRLAA